MGDISFHFLLITVTYLRLVTCPVQTEEIHLRFKQSNGDTQCLQTVLDVFIVSLWLNWPVSPSVQLFCGSLLLDTPKWLLCQYENSYGASAYLGYWQLPLLQRRKSFTAMLYFPIPLQYLEKKTSSLAHSCGVRNSKYHYAEGNRGSVHLIMTDDLVGGSMSENERLLGQAGIQGVGRIKFFMDSLFLGTNSGSHRNTWIPSGALTRWPDQLPMGFTS